MNEKIEAYVTQSLFSKEIPGAVLKECKNPDCKHENCSQSNSGRYFYAYIPDLTETELQLILQVKTNKLLKKIFGCAVFFVILTVVSVIVGLIPFFME